MRPHAPSSRAYFRIRISVLDASFAVLSPILALALRDAPVLSDRSYSLYFLLGLLHDFFANLILNLSARAPRRSIFFGR